MKQHCPRRIVSFFLGLLLICAWMTPAAAGTAAGVVVTGRLSNGGAAVPDGTYLITWRLHTAAQGGQSIWSEVATKVQVAGSRFHHTVGLAKPVGGPDTAMGAALKQGPLWLGTQIANEPELERIPLHAGAFSSRVAVAESLACTGCVSLAALKSDGDLDLGGGALVVKQVVAAGLQAQGLIAQVLTGDGSKVSGAQPSPSSCPAGQVVNGVDSQGKVKCMAGGAAGSDALEQASNNLLTTKAGGPMSSVNTPMPIADNNPVGTVDEVVVDDLGKASALTVSVHLTNSDLTTVEVLLYDPNNAVYTLHKDKAGKELKETWPTTAQLVSGDLSSWLGANPKGKWRLRIIDKGFLNNGDDGELKSWSVNILVASGKQVTVTGSVNASAGLGLQVSAGPPFACDAKTVAAQYWDSKDAGLYYCDGTWRRLLVEPLCGNGVINGGETCDDKNTDDGDGCTAKCQKNVCGDGVIWVGVEQCDDGNLADGDGCDSKCKGGMKSCRNWSELAGAKKNGTYLIDPDGPGPNAPFQVYCDMVTNGGGWTLIARFANADATNWMLDTGQWWYTRTAAAGTPLSRSANADMYSPAFHTVVADEMRLSRTSNPDDSALLVTKGKCLGAKTFRAKITSYGDFQNGKVWGSNSVKGSCDVTLGGNYAQTNGFQYATCNGNIGGANKISFWSDWSSGDGAVMMIGGGGSCGRADHGIGVTEANAACFVFSASGEEDFGNNGTNYNDAYALNLWVR